GHGYPVTTGSAGSGGFYLLEFPFYPLLVLGSFWAAGHRFLALELPLVAANLAMPFVYYRLCRVVGAGPGLSPWLTLAALCSPYYQVYALGAPEPESLLALELALLLWLGLHLSEVRNSQPSANLPSPRVSVGEGTNVPLPLGEAAERSEAGKGS